MYHNTKPFQLIACITLAAIAGCRSTTEPTALPSGAINRPTTGRLMSPSGQIAYGLDDPATGEPHVFIVRPDGVGEHQLDVPYPAAVPAWSPDGGKLLISVFLPEALRPVVVNPDGSGLRVLELPEVPSEADRYCRAWSPDGGRLLCTVINFAGDHTADGIYSVRSSDGGDAIRLTVNPYPPAGNFGGGDIPGSYSPDGTRFVFMRAKPGAGPVPDRNQKGALFVENTDGSGLRQITPYGLANSHDDGVAHWSPDGSDILFAGEQGGLFVVRADGTGVRRIPLKAGSFSFVRAPDWSPDGRRIVFSMFLRKTGRFDLYTANADGGGLAPLTQTPGFEDFADWGANSPAVPASSSRP
jgi:WD40 repeat protein